MLDKYQILAIIAIIIVVIIIVVLSSRSKIFKTYAKYMKVGNKMNITGKQLAFISKQLLELDDLKFALIEDKLADAYSPKHKTLIISREVCDTASLSSLTIVAHELGHAVQHKESTALFFVTQTFSKITRFTNNFIIPLLIFGLFMYIFKYPSQDIGYYLMMTSAILFLAHVLNKVLTIPLEYDASRRALKFLKENKFVSDSELKKAKKLLSIAAQTYIASLFDDMFTLTKKKYKKRK